MFTPERVRVPVPDLVNATVPIASSFTVPLITVPPAPSPVTIRVLMPAMFEPVISPAIVSEFALELVIVILVAPTASPKIKSALNN